jgi:hypothetical protein
MTCPGDTLVWVNTQSGVYHFQGDRYFGGTKRGKFVCERDADEEGDPPTHRGQSLSAGRSTLVSPVAGPAD